MPLSILRLLLFSAALILGGGVAAQRPCYNYSNPIDPKSMQLATINLRDSSFEVFANIRKDYRIVGYSSSNICSERLIIFSVFTNDVERNPYNCPFGAFYSTSSTGKNSVVIKYIGRTKFFIKADLFINGQKRSTLYFERGWVRFNK